MSGEPPKKELLFSSEVHMGKQYFEAGEYEYEDGDVVSYPAGDYVYDEDQDDWFLVEDGECYEMDEYESEEDDDSDEGEVVLDLD